MDFSFNDEQKQLQEMLEKFIQRDYGFDQRRKHQASPDGFSREVWSQFAEMGLLGLPFDEQYGGMNGDGKGTSAEMLVVMTAIGNGLMVEPYLPTVVLAGGAISRAGSAAQKEALLPAIAEGKLIAALALGEPGARYDLNHVATTAKRNGSEYTLSGRKSVVLNGAQADKLIVSARTGGANTDERGVSLFVVDRKARGVSVRDYRTIDGLRAADISFENAGVAADALLGDADAALPVIEAVADAAVAALCTEGVGVMETLNRLTLDYMKNRQQFGQPIAGFQVLQHRAVDMFIHAEQSKSMAYLAMLKSWEAGVDAAERRKAVSAAKVHLGQSGRKVAQEAIQLHGGMGMTNELPASHYAKRLTMIDMVLGDGAHHLARFEKA
jgi:alkylation response protein AidB-like acyl-CoA dehydrogenase